MSKTVEDLIKLEGFDNIRIIAGHKGLSNTVRSASFMEVPDIFAYLEEGTLLLTTLFPIASKSNELSHFIPSLKSCGVAGVCIKPKRYIDEIPHEMIKQANELALPLLELPPDANLSTLANQVLSLSLNEHISQLEFLDNLHTSLAGLLLDDSNIADLLKKLGQLIHKDILILNEDFSFNCASSKEGSPLSCDQVQERLDLNEIAKKKRSLVIGHQLHLISAGDRRFGYIYVFDYPNKTPETKQLKVALEQSVILLSALFLKDDAVIKNQKNFRDVFIRDLLQGKVRSPFELESKMRAFSMSLSFPQPIMCVKIFTENESVRKEFYDKVINSGFFQKQFSLLYNNKNEQAYLVYFNDAVVILSGIHREEELLEILHEAMPSLRELAGAHNAKIGIGLSAPCIQVNNLNAAYVQAMSVLKTGKTLNRGSFIESYSKHRIFSIIEEVKDIATLERFVEDKIGPLIAHDLQNDTNLMETIGFLVDGGLNFRDVAKRSHVHYNTVRYRVNKIEQLGISLKPGRDFAEIAVAYDSWLWLKALSE